MKKRDLCDHHKLAPTFECAACERMFRWLSITATTSAECSWLLAYRASSVHLESGAGQRRALRDLRAAARAYATAVIREATP